MTIVIENRTQELPLKALVERYNQLATVLNLRPVSKFENRSIALKRLERAEAEYREYSPKPTSIANQVVNGIGFESAPEPKVAEPVAPTQTEVVPNRKKREKVFNYPPLDELKPLKAGTLRAEARDLLKNGATLGRIEELVAKWSLAVGKKPNRLEPRAYGLVRLLHSYIGYGLREEKINGEVVIYVMEQEEWEVWKSQKVKS